MIAATITSATSMMRITVELLTTTLHQSRQPAQRARPVKVTLSAHNNSVTVITGAADRGKHRQAATCLWMSGPRAKRGMPPLPAHEARPCSIYGEAFLEVR